MAKKSTMSMSASNSSSFGCCCCCDVIAVADVEVNILCWLEELTLVTLIGILTSDDARSRLLLPLAAATVGHGCCFDAVEDTVLAMAEEDELIDVPPPFVVVVEVIDVGDRLNWSLLVFQNCRDIIQSKSVA